MKIMSVISGKAYWASVVNPNTTFEPVWSIDVSLDDKNKAIVEQDGLKVKNKGDERGDFVTIKRKVEGKNGVNQPPVVMDAHKRPLPEGVLVGNGSDVNVQYKPYEWTWKGNAGIGADLRKIQVVNLVPYEEEDDELDVIPSGYSAVEQLEDDIPFGN
jgi:hypothetical protein